MNRQKLIDDVRNEMFANGIRIKELAYDMGYSPQTLYNFFSGKKKSKSLESELIKRFMLKGSDYE